MACLLYSRTGIEKSPYASLLDPVHWLDICDIFARDACALLGLSLESPLQVCITAGCVALPSLLQIRQVMQQRQVTGVWTSKDELPVRETCNSQVQHGDYSCCQKTKVVICNDMRMFSTERFSIECRKTKTKTNYFSANLKL